jgi:hypothetical protein
VLVKLTAVHEQLKDDKRNADAEIGALSRMLEKAVLSPPKPLSSPKSMLPGMSPGKMQFHWKVRDA